VNATFLIDRNYSDLFPEGGNDAADQDIFDRWDRKVLLTSTIDPATPSRNSMRLTAAQEPGDGALEALVQRVIQVLRTRKETLYLSLDADRTYPAVGFNQLAFASELMNANFDAGERQRSSVRASSMYQEWERVTLSSASRIKIQWYDAVKKARDAGTGPPEFVDVFKTYQAAIGRILPHLDFIGANTDGTGLLFNSSGVDLPFSRLSGGEREIAFILGQIERFRLRSGLLMIDEPELHLNPDLVRNWIAFLSDYINEGQIWIATHSMEAVEAAGRDQSFVLGRSESNRLVTEAFALASRPVMSTLAVALGTPGFSIAALTFFYIEGEYNGDEAQQFYDIYGDSRFVRFMGAGNAREVSRKFVTLRELAQDADQQIFSGGIVDRDFRTIEEVTNLEGIGLFVLPCHEIENFYLEPNTLQAAFELTGSKAIALEALRQIANGMAGRWIVQQALYLVDYSAPIDRSGREVIAHEWSEIISDKDGFAQRCASALGTADHTDAHIRAAIEKSIDVYEGARMKDDFWQHCFGKQVLPMIVRYSGYSGVSSLRSVVLKHWRDQGDAAPEHVKALRSYIGRTASR